MQQTPHNARPAVTASSGVRPLLIMGTRPEAIKMAPLIHRCQERAGRIDPIVCFTGQHKQMLAQVADYFGIEADLDLELMRPNQTLAQLTSRCITGLDEAIDRFQPDCLVAQGDTTTVMAASLAAFYRKLPFIHVEAGLRTHNLYSPWPEEFNRRVAGLTAAVHCAPTPKSAQFLLDERVDPQSVHITGNTVIDALLWTAQRERLRNAHWVEQYVWLGDREMVLITGHRRENFGSKFEGVCRAIARLAGQFPEKEFVYPVHLNPNVREPVYRILKGHDNVHLTEPAAYPEFVWLMDRATLIITDSGGVQEEAPSLKKPVLVTRETTERPEAVDAGAVELVGVDEETIVQRASLLLENPAEYAKRQLDTNPYGDGQASERIIDLIEAQAWEQTAHRVAA